MGRITKRMKEEGTANTRPSSDQKKKGFNTVPARAPKDAYLGKAKKIKADLIQRAKLKQSYAKLLKSEGLTSDRLSSPSSRKGQERVPSSSTNPSSRPESQPEAGPSRRPRAPDAPTAAGRARALSPSDIGPPMPQTSLRDLKKEAFAKYHEPRGRGAAGRGREGDDVGKAGRGNSSGGQPNMSARMGVLLEKIKRDKGR